MTVAVLQGTLAAMMFWWLGLPGPMLWGIVMTILAIIPYLGTFVIWGPVAVYFFLQGETSKALLLTAWGGIVVALIDNLLYPVLVGRRLRYHTLPVFFFILGGVSFFGAAGLILGPAMLAFADALRDIWRRRFAARSPSDTALAPSH